MDKSLSRSAVLKKLVGDKKFQELVPTGVLGVNRPPITWVSTGNYALDWCVSGKLFDGGLPVGRIVEIFGDPSAGKSLIVCGIMGNVQRMGGIAIYDDAEESADKEFMEKMGCDVSEQAMLLKSSKTVEEHFKAVEFEIEKIRSLGFTGVIVVVLDSLASVSTRHEVETGLDKVDMARAKVIKAAMRLMGGTFARKGVLYVLLNHTISNMGVRFPSKVRPAQTTPGGGGPKFHASVRVELVIRELYQDVTNLITGVKVKATVVKNKMAPPFRQCEIDCFYKSGVDICSGLFKVLQQAGVVTSVSSGWYRYKDGTKNIREEDIMELVKADLGGKSDVDTVRKDNSGGAPAAE